MGIICGGFYRLLGLSSSKERIAQILSVLQPTCILTIHHYDEQLTKLPTAYKVIHPENISQTTDEQKLTEIRTKALDTDLLYCNFTSGPTRVHKGAGFSHCSIIDFTDIFAKNFKITSCYVLGNHAPFLFDVSVKDVYSSIKLGVTLVPIPKSDFMFPAKLLELLEENL